MFPNISKRDVFLECLFAIKHKIETHFNLAETEIEVRIESLKLKLDNIGKEFKNKVNESKKTVNK